MSGNNIGDEGAKALGPHLAKLNNMTTLNLWGTWRQECLSMHRRCLFVGNVASMMTTWLCVSDVRQQHWGGRRESTGPTPGDAQQHDNVERGVCVMAILFEHAQEMLVCWQCGVNDGAGVWEERTRPTKPCGVLTCR